MSYSPQQLLMLELSVSHAKECADFMALPRMATRKTKYGEITSCRHCKGTLWTADELRKVVAVRDGVHQQRATGAASRKK